MKIVRNIVFAFAALFATVALAEEAIPPSPIVKTQLLVDDQPLTDTMEPSWVGVRFTMPPNWHIYWQNPGDSGIPTTFTWTGLMKGATAGNILWPTPERIEVSGLMNYGYSNEVILQAPLTGSMGVSGSDFTLEVKWLVCHEICIPESATFTSKVPTNFDGEAHPPSVDALALKKARDSVPHANSTDGSFTVDSEKNVLLRIPGIALAADAKPITSVHWFPAADGIIQNAAQQTLLPMVASDGNAATTITLSIPRGSAEIPATWDGVLVLETAKGKSAYSATLAHDGNAAAPDAAAPRPAAQIAPVEAPMALLPAILLAFLGGLILNIMPCVLPILALKALAITKKAQTSRAAAAQQGIAYTAGVVLSFLVIAGIMLTLKASGAAIGWGFQLQNSGFVLVLAIIMLLVAANLLGLFQLPVLFGSKATGVDDNSRGGSFFTGALAVMVATPCTAPFMATAIGATLALPTASALLVFAALGFGMASPFLLISLWPAARRWIPKPGVWMHRFKQILSLPMLATAAWLIWVLMQMHGMAPQPMEGGHAAYSASALAQLRANKTPVLVDATAAWCLTCKVNERVALQPADMQQFFRDKNITIMVADWTNADPAITEYLASFGRNGVPLYVYYPANGEPVVLPQILTPSTVRDIINKANE